MLTEKKIRAPVRGLLREMAIGRHWGEDGVVYASVWGGFLAEETSAASGARALSSARVSGDEIKRERKSRARGENKRER